MLLLLNQGMKLKLIFGPRAPRCGSRALPVTKALAQLGLLCLPLGLTMGEMDHSSVGGDFYSDFF